MAIDAARCRPLPSKWTSAARSTSNADVEAHAVDEIGGRGGSKYDQMPFLADVVSGSRSPPVFMVELGAAIQVASTAVPVVIIIRPLACKMSLTSRRKSVAGSCLSGRWRNLRIVVSSGSRARPSSSLANSRNAGISWSDGSESADHGGRW
jgi:hypothetical protein